ncbi:hypothetical protein [Nocardioides alcanivorans]|uniref:hypothetical protein n=1 Tax=Nocardioides alcanivorans TaxID=2897352 RepID=UPI001F2B0A67|nr:hypothetical protein [Nocardioides alcanivorans]
MSRRVSLPAADDLFRPTSSHEPAPAPDPAPAAPEAGKKSAGRTTGRIRHDEKMTVYISSDELFEIEQARLALRRDHKLAVDRGRLVRQAVALALADLEEHGEDSQLVQRLREP